MGTSVKVDTLSSGVDGPRLNRALYDLIAEQKGLTTRTAQAEFHGVWRGYWSGIYHGRRSSSFELKHKIARQFEVTVDELWIGLQ